MSTLPTDPVLCHTLPSAGTLSGNINKPLHQPRVVPCHQISIISAVKMAALLRAGEDNDADWARPHTGCDIRQSHRIPCRRRVICGAGTRRGWRRPLWDWAACQSSWTLIGWNADWPCGAGSGYVKCLFLSTLMFDFGTSGWPIRGVNNFEPWERLRKVIKRDEIIIIIERTDTV